MLWPLMAASVPLGVEVGTGLEQVRVRDSNTVQRLRTGLPGFGAI